MSEESRANEFRFLAEMTKEIRDRLFGNYIGTVEETMAILELKSACPHDDFSEEQSSRHGTDILAAVREKGEIIGKISISVKHQGKWNSNFITQLEKNIRNDNSGWGLLVTTVFPKESLNENVWTTFDSSGRLLLMTKPAYVSVAYYAIRQIVIYQHLLKSKIQKYSLKEMVSTELQEQELANDHSIYVPVETNKRTRAE